MKRINQIDRKIKKSSKNISIMCKIIKYSIIVLPILFSIVAFACTSNINLLQLGKDINHPTLLIIAIILCVLMVIDSVLYFFVGREEDIFIGELNENRNLLIENQKLKQSNEDIQKYNNVLIENYLNNLTELSQFIRYINNLFPMMISRILQSRNNLQDFYNHFSDLMNILYEYLNYIYKPSCHQIFTVALYLFDPKEQSDYKLKPYYSQKPDMIKRGKGRWWKIGDGQIGLTYMNNSSYNYQNLEEQINPKTSNKKYDDDLCYVSVLSFPIHYSNGMVRGVFCITSNVISAFYNNSDKFNNKISETKEVCSKTLASIIEMCINEVFENDNSALFDNLPDDEIKAISAENPIQNTNDEQ